MNDLHIERLWLNNNLRNYHYIAVCQQTGEALVVDPMATDLILDTVNQHNWKVKAVVNTHDHGDHIAGNDIIMRETGAPLIAPKGADINHVNRWIGEGDEIKLGESIRFTTLETPGHTLTHVSLLSNTETPELLCGDTIFNAGAGNVHSGDAGLLFETFANKISTLDDSTRIYPGHDYLQTNLEFTLSIEPDNQAARELLATANQLSPENQVITNLGQEKNINTFLRLDRSTIIQHLMTLNPDLGNPPTSETVFRALRELRNTW